MQVLGEQQAIPKDRQGIFPGGTVYCDAEINSPESKELPSIRFFALWLIALLLAASTLAPLINAIRWW